MSLEDKNMEHMLVKLEDILSRLEKSRDNEEAWSELYINMWPWVFSHIYRYLRGAGKSAEDASQDVFLRLLRYCKFQKVQDPLAFQAYLRTICKNVARNYLSETYKRSEIELHLEEKNEIFFKEEEERMTAIERVLNSLDEPEKQLIRLAIDGYSMQEIAQKTEWSYSNTAIRLYRLRKKIRNYLLHNLPN